MSTDGGHTLSFSQTNEKCRNDLEVWGGVLTLDPDSRYSITETLAGTLRIARSELRGAASFYRSANAVRMIEQHFYIVTFVDNGSIAFDPTFRNNITSSTFAISRSSGGYRAFMRSEPDHTMTVHHAFIPLPMLAPFLSREALLGVNIPTTEGPALMAKELLALIFRNNRHLSRDLRRFTTECFVKLLGEAITGAIDLNVQKKGIDRRYDDIQKYILDNSPHPNISAKQVARKFGISPRYLSKILNKRDETFPRILRKSRVDLSTRLLTELPVENYNIADIASICGFKSISHFNRVFIEITGRTPRQYRSAAFSEGSARAPANPRQ